ncbi:hypothetical protein [Nonomuraea rubra]|uniref:SbtR family transcriptional regulator n=1 Tax=Nonomuraea rubra TaxID=46180 RepID=UPI0033CA0534
MGHLDVGAQVNGLVERLLRRAQREGALRPDVGPADLAFFVMGNSRVAEADPGSGAATST